MSIAKDPPAALPLDEAVAKALVKSCQGGCGDWRRHTADAQRAITAYAAALAAAPPGDLVGADELRAALRECRDVLERWISYGGEDFYRGSDTVDAITRADAALASPERPESEESDG